MLSLKLVLKVLSTLQEAAVGVVPNRVLITALNEELHDCNSSVLQTGRLDSTPVPERLLESHDAKLLCKYLTQ